MLLKTRYLEMGTSECQPESISLRAETQGLAIFRLGMGRATL
jgi:hypothetical protein